MQLCVRRDGQVLIDRAIGHARGNGPHDDVTAVIHELLHGAAAEPGAHGQLLARLGLIM